MLNKAREHIRKFDVAEKRGSYEVADAHIEHAARAYLAASNALRAEEGLSLEDMPKTIEFHDVRPTGIANIMQRVAQTINIPCSIKKIDADLATDGGINAAANTRQVDIAFKNRGQAQRFWDEVTRTEVEEIDRNWPK